MNTNNLNTALYEKMATEQEDVYKRQPISRTVTCCVFTITDQGRSGRT